MVASQQCRRVILHEVNLAAESLRLARVESAHARVVVQAHDRALEQFLCLVKGSVLENGYRL